MNKNHYNFNSNPKEHLIMLGMSAVVFIFSFIGLIISYFVWKEFSKESRYIEVNGKNMLNFYITFIILILVANVTRLIFIGMIIGPIVGVAFYVFSITGMIKYGKHLDYEYPLVIKFIR